MQSDADQLEQRLMLLVYPFGRQSYLNNRSEWDESVAREVEAVERAMEHSDFWYLACGSQEVYKVRDSGAAAFNELIPTLNRWVVSQVESQRRMAREVTTW